MRYKKMQTSQIVLCVYAISVVYLGNIQAGDDNQLLKESLKNTRGLIEKSSSEYKVAGTSTFNGTNEGRVSGSVTMAKYGCYIFIDVENALGAYYSKRDQENHKQFIQRQQTYYSGKSQPIRVDYQKNQTGSKQVVEVTCNTELLEQDINDVLFYETGLCPLFGHLNESQHTLDSLFDTCSFAKIDKKTRYEYSSLLDIGLLTLDVSMIQNKPYITRLKIQIDASNFAKLSEKVKAFYTNMHHLKKTTATAAEYDTLLGISNDQPVVKLISIKSGISVENATNTFTESVSFVLSERKVLNSESDVQALLLPIAGERVLPSDPALAKTTLIYSDGEVVRQVDRRPVEAVVEEKKTFKATIWVLVSFLCLILLSITIYAVFFRGRKSNAGDAK
jgi:hypothetical protein